MAADKNRSGLGTDQRETREAYFQVLIRVHSRKLAASVFNLRFICGTSGKALKHRGLMQQLAARKALKR